VGEGQGRGGLLKVNSFPFSESLKKIQKILIIGPAWIGDMMMAHSLVQLLKIRNPRVEIHVLASPWTQALLKMMPEVSRIIDMPLGHGAFALSTRYQLGKKLRIEKYDQAILLPNSFKSALIPFFAKIPVRTGWRGEMRYGLLTDIYYLDKKRFPLMVQRYMALGLEKNAEPLTEFPYPKLQVDLTNQENLLNQFLLNLDRPILVICPGAEYGPSKRWPENYYAEVAKEKIQQGWQVWLMGSAKDKQVTDLVVDVVADKDHIKNLAGATNLTQAIQLIALSDAVVTNDSGLMHISAALDKPLVVIYGSTSPEHTPPLARHVKIVSLNLECSPCFERECPKEHNNCMKELLPSQVMFALDDLLARPVEVTK
jgi:heptosyltransferase-2